MSNLDTADTEAAPAARLTKRELKALRHRTGQGSKGAAAKRKAAVAAAIPDTPEQDLIEEEEEVERPSKKRKLEAATEDAAPAADGGSGKGKQRAKTAWEEEDKPVKSKQRLICFVGNLPYTVDQNQIAAHFAAQCGETPSVRLLTPKTPTDAKKPSKGCAFVEFVEPAAMQQALKLHHSSLNGRKINVELTAGGGGTGETRKAKLAKAKTRLDAQRVKKAPAEAAAAKKGDEETPKLSKNAKRRGKPGAAEGGKQQKPRKERKPVKPQLSGANTMRLG